MFVFSLFCVYLMSIWYTCTSATMPSVLACHLSVLVWLWNPVWILSFIQPVLNNMGAFYCLMIQREPGAWTHAWHASITHKSDALTTKFKQIEQGQFKTWTV